MSTYQCMVRGRWHRGAGVGTGWEGVFGVAGDDSSDRDGDGGDSCGDIVPVVMAETTSRRMG